jgi:small GTP-binding protein
MKKIDNKYIIISLNMVKMAKDDVTKMRIKRIEKEIRDTPYHKATEHHIGRLRARLSKLKDSLEISSGKKGGGGGGYAVKKQGDATVVLVGPPSAGKSTLLNKLTNAQSKVAPYAFTTLTVIPGMMEYKDAKIQILDVPGLIEGAEEGKGRGREVLSVVRGSDLIIIMTDVERPEATKRIEEALERNGIRLNKTPPEVITDKKLSGGIIVHTNIKQEMSTNTIKEVASEMGIKNAEITINEKLSMERLIDAFSTNRVYIPTMHVINKTDLKKSSSFTQRYYDSNHSSNISAENETGLEELRKKIWQKLDFIRVYLVHPKEEPSKKHPMVVKKDSILKDVMENIGEDFAENKIKAKIWGNGAKFPGQDVSLSKKALDGMQVRFI